MKSRPFAVILALCFFGGSLSGSGLSGGGLLIGLAQARIQSSPAGASAECGDGMYSTSTEIGGCRYHGGLARWIDRNSLAVPSFPLPRVSAPSSLPRNAVVPPPGPPRGFHRQPGAVTFVPNGYYYDVDSNRFKKGALPHSTLPKRRRLPPRNTWPKYPASWSGKCVRVIDGDTFIMLYGRTPVRIRLWGVDCPELTQLFGGQAKAYTSRFILGKTVKIFNKGYDTLERTRGWIFRGKICLNSILVHDGYAWWYRSYSADTPQLGSLEHLAMVNHRGLWADLKAIEPWEWRHYAE